MLKDLRESYNKKFTVEAYGNFLEDVWKITGGEIDFRICETPFFIDDKLSAELEKACDSILQQLRNPEFRKYNISAVPPNLFVKNEDTHPRFLQIDFGIVKTEEGFIPKLIELQGFPSLYAFQIYIDQKIRDHFEIEPELTTYWNNYNFNTYTKKLGNILLGDSDPENVILLEINPFKQKTRIDFILTEQYTGIAPVSITSLVQKGKKLYYKKGRKLIPVERIYNRVIFDELHRMDLELNFDFHDDLDVTWVGHPNWFFRISKHTLPYFDNKYVPRCHFIDEIDYKKVDLNDYVLKPLYSFAGAGVVVDVTEKLVDSIENKRNYILQEKVEYSPLMDTPDSGAKVEVRMMFLWEDEPVLVNNLLRVSKGQMMGVDFNKNKSWIGASTAYHKSSSQ